MMNNIIFNIKNILKENYNLNYEIIGLYNYGSRNYNINNDFSDYDYVLILNCDEELYLQYETPNLDLHICSETYYKKLLEEHHIMALECFYSKNPIIKYECTFTLDKIKLRHFISNIVNNSWVKAKKKITLENEDSYIGIKSLNHSFRILDFAIQIATYNDIVDFDFSKKSILNSKDFDINNLDWNIIKDLFKNKHNKMMSDFRLLATKTY